MANRPWDPVLSLSADDASHFLYLRAWPTRTRSLHVLRRRSNVINTTFQNEFADVCITGCEWS